MVEIFEDGLQKDIDLSLKKSRDNGGGNMSRAWEFPFCALLRSAGVVNESISGCALGACQATLSRTCGARALQ